MSVWDSVPEPDWNEGENIRVGWGLSADMKQSILIKFKEPMENGVILSLNDAEKMVEALTVSIANAKAYREGN